MISLLQNEWMKSIKRNKITIFFSILAALVLIGVIAVKIGVSRLGFEMTGVDYTRYSIGVFTTIVSFYTIVLGSSIVTSEYKDGTIKQLFIRFHSRTSIFLAKYIMVVLISVLLYFSLILFNFLLGWVFFGYASVLEAIQLNGSIGLYSLPNLLFYITLAFTIGSISRSNGLALGLTFLVKFSSGPIVLIVALYDWGKYVIFPNLTLTPFSENPLINGGMNHFMEGLTLGFSLMVICIYTVSLVILSLFVTEKRDVL